MHMYQLLQCTYMAKCDFANHVASIKHQNNKLFVDYTKADNNYTFFGHLLSPCHPILCADE